MKITDLAILFVFITLPFVIMLRVKSDNLLNVEYKSMLLNKYLDTAVEDASKAMVEKGTDNSLSLSRGKAVAAFFRTLYANLGIIHDETAKQSLKAYIPVIAVIGYDGYWIYSLETYRNENGELVEDMLCKPKKPYVYKSNGFSYLFTLDDYVKVYDSAGNMFYEGRREEVMQNLPDDRILNDRELFEQIRKRTIVEAMKSDVNIAINEHNNYAEKYGISYHFSPPSIPDDDWQKNIEDVGILSFFQGMPIGLGGERFNSFALGAARIVRKKAYYIQQHSNGLYYYHRETCPLVTDRDNVYDSRQECALKGAFPCHTCNP